MHLTTAIIPVAGYGTRRLPITKSVEKCMLPICNRPIIDYTIEACVAAGVQNIIFVVSPEYEQLKRYYETDPALQAYLERNGKAHLAQSVDTSSLTLHYVVQDLDGPYGTAVPVWLARDLVKDDECFLVLTGDDLLYHPQDQGANIKNMMQMLDNNAADSCMIGVELAKEDVTKYGLLEPKQVNGIECLARLTEKPTIDQVTHNVANVSKYLFKNDIFPYIERVMQHPNEKGEHYLTEAVEAYAETHAMAIVRSVGQYLDGGNLDDWIKANNTVYEQSRTQ